MYPIRCAGRWGHDRLSRICAGSENWRLGGISLKKRRLRRGIENSMYEGQKGRKLSMQPGNRHLKEFHLAAPQNAWRKWQAVDRQAVAGPRWP